MFILLFEIGKRQMDTKVGINCRIKGALMCSDEKGEAFVLMKADIHWLLLIFNLHIFVGEESAVSREPVMRLQSYHTRDNKRIS